MSFPSREQKNLKNGQNAQSWAHMLNQGRLHPRLVVIVPLDSYHWILQPNISRFTWRKWRNFPLESCKDKKIAKMLVMGPICSIRAACCPWSAQKSPFLTSQIDSTVWKTLYVSWNRLWQFDGFLPPTNPSLYPTEINGRGPCEPSLTS